MVYIKKIKFECLRNVFPTLNSIANQYLTQKQIDTIPSACLSLNRLPDLLTASPQICFMVNMLYRKWRGLIRNRKQFNNPSCSSAFICQLRLAALMSNLDSNFDVCHLLDRGHEYVEFGVLCNNNPGNGGRSNYVIVACELGKNLN